jgi:hypothetical protein
MRGNWIVVAAAEHAARGRAGGFMQACHGKAAPLRRIRPGDVVACYSPTVTFGGSDKCRAFTALGIVGAAAPYPFDMGGGFCPYRRDVRWLAADAAPIEPLREELELTAGRRNWGYMFRFGLVPASEPDMRCIAAAMGVPHLPA